MPGDYYQLLGVTERATPEEIRRAYYAMVRRCPPEKEPERFMALRKAYDVLSDSELRGEYDTYRVILALESRADQHYAAEEWDEAAELCRQAAQLAPGELYFHAMQAVSLHRGGRLVEAIQVLEWLTQQDPNESDFWYYLGSVLSHRAAILPEAEIEESAQLLEQARHAYTRALALAPGNPDIHFDLGRAYSSMGQWEEALLSFDRALMIDGQDASKRMKILLFVLQSTISREYGRHSDLWSTVWSARARGATALADLPSVDAVVSRMMGVLREAPAWARYEAATELMEMVSDDLGTYAYPATVLCLEAVLRIDPDHSEAGRFLAECTARVRGNDGSGTVAAAHDPDQWWIVLVCAVIGAAAAGPAGFVAGLLVGSWLNSNSK